MKKREIFRQDALKRVSSPEQLDQLMEVTNPRGWAALLALGLLLFAAILWAFLGTIPTKVTGQGVLLAPGGVKEAISTFPGQITSLNVDVGDRVEAGEVVAQVAETDRVTPTTIVSPYAGRVLEIKVDDGDLIERGTPILSIEALDEEPGELEVALYLPAAEGKKVRPGMSVQIAPSTVERERFGLLLGEVVSVGKFPVTRQGMLRVLGSEPLVEALSTGGPQIQVRADLTPDPDTPSGYTWSSSAGPPDPITSGTLCQVWITIREQRPLSLVLPAADR